MDRKVYSGYPYKRTNLLVEGQVILTVFRTFEVENIVHGDFGEEKA